MRKTIVITFLMLSVCAFAQTIAPGYKVVLRAINTPNNTYIPPDPLIFAAGKVQTATITVNFTRAGDPDGFNPTSAPCPNCLDWPVNARAAMEHAAFIWSNSITSDVDIVIVANWRDLGNPNFLGQAGPTTVSRNFGPVVNPRFQDDTWFPIALANSMTGTDQSPALPDIVAEFNSTFTNFFFGTAGGATATQFDFVTVALHELGHGLGFTSSCRDDDATATLNLVYGFSNFPLIFDRSVVNNLGTRLTTLTSPSAALTTFLQSNNVFFDGPEAVTANGNANARLFAPTTWEQGSSISHLDEGTFAGANGLMTSGLNLQETIHNPGAVGVGIMRDIGWIDALIFTGIEDELDIYDGAFFPYAPPVTELNVGSSYDYQMVFTDEEPYNTIIQRHWKLEVLYEGGKYPLHSANNTSFWNFTLLNLPSGYKWLRNIHGQVRAVITATTYDNNYWPNEAKLPVLINFKPNKPEVRITNNPNNSRFARWGCASAQVNFYSYGATSHNIHYKKASDPFFITVPVPNGMHSYTFTGLDEGSNYIFQVEAINTTGGTLSDPITRKSCLASILPKSPNVFVQQFNNSLNELLSVPLITAFPNPCIFTVRFNITSSVGALIQRVELRNTANPNIGKTIIVNPSSNFIDVAVWDLPTGIYTATITDTNNFTATLTIIKI